MGYRVGRRKQGERKERGREGREEEIDIFLDGILILIYHQLTESGLKSSAALAVTMALST